MKAERICSKVRKYLEVAKERAQMTSKQLTFFFNKYNQIWHPYGFIINSLKASIKIEAQAEFRFSQNISMIQKIFKKNASRSQKFLAIMITISFFTVSSNFERIHNYYQEQQRLNQILDCLFGRFLFIIALYFPS